jgi:hypothetical protein
MRAAPTVLRGQLRQHPLGPALQASQQKARAVFCKHNVVDAWDAPSDISRMYKIRAVPTLVFYDEGAVVSDVQAGGPVTRV